MIMNNWLTQRQYKHRQEALKVLEKAKKQEQEKRLNKSQALKTNN